VWFNTEVLAMTAGLHWLLVLRCSSLPRHASLSIYRLFGATPLYRLPATTAIQSLGCFTDVEGDRAMEIDQSQACGEGEVFCQPRR